MQDENLLKLILVYSAGHRARLLQHAAPMKRIALYLHDVLRYFQSALADATEAPTMTNLATAITLASLEIVSPGLFEMTVPWQQHLKVAGEMIRLRGGYSFLLNNKDPVSWFLSRWYGYLWVMGAFSGNSLEQDLCAKFWSHDPARADAAEDNQVDCFLGFAPRVLVVLAKVASLVCQCDRAFAQTARPDGQLSSAWRPSGATIMLATKLKQELQVRESHEVKVCSHVEYTDHSAAEDLKASNVSYHLAGVIHLQRRVLRNSINSAPVQDAVRGIVEALRQTSDSRIAANNMIFPLFTAGCQAIEPEHRQAILQGFEKMENYGMEQVHKAKKLLERVWATNMAPERLIVGEFIG